MIYLEGKGVDTSDVLDATTVPEEFLRDTSYWMQADEMEIFLKRSQEQCRKSAECDQLMQVVGHECADLRAWGVLDSVLRMMPRPQEILSQPERFLSYFISPSPPIDNLTHSEVSVDFDIPVSADQYPLATSFLAAAFEALPNYVGQPVAKCEWSGIHVQITWNLDQKSLFEGQETGRQISPELMRNVLSSLEKHSRELEEKNRELQAKNELLIQGQGRSEDAALTLPMVGSVVAAPEPQRLAAIPLAQEQALFLSGQLSRLQDYMVRAQQLITILVAQGRMSSQVKEAMKRVDWERVRDQFPVTIEECRKSIAPVQPHKGEPHV